MECLTQVSAKELCGRSTRLTACMEQLALQNALNRTGTINYNKYGTKDGIGFIPCSEKFVESFQLHVLVPDYLVHKNKYLEIANVNKCLWESLKQHGLNHSHVTATGLRKTKLQEHMLHSVPFRCREKETDDTNYYLQEYKIACAEEAYDRVLSFLRAQDYNTSGLFLKDIDVSMNYAGSFDKIEVLEALVNTKGFRLQHADHNDEERTILLNSRDVGRNCLTYMETRDDMTTRCRIYNKMVKILEYKGLQYRIGQHWLDWVHQTSTRLAKARDLARQRGLTHAKVTFSCGSRVPDDAFIEETLLRVTSYVDASLVYSTPYEATWKAYCDTFQHSLVIIDRHHDTALLVYSVNEVTKNVSGNLVRKWSEKERWCLAHLLLSGSLPVDVIDIHRACTTFSKKTKDTLLDIQGARYFRKTESGGIDFSTRLVSHGGVYVSRHQSTKGQNDWLLENAGFVPHPNCTPQLAHQRADKTTKIDLVLVLSGELHVFAKPAASEKRKLSEH